MTKKIKIVTCIILMLMGIKVVVSAETFSSNITVDFDEWVVTYSGFSGDDPIKLVNATVVSGEGVPNDSNIIGIDSVYTDENGSYSGRVYLSENTAPGVYKAFVDSENGSASKRFIVIDETETAFYLTALNSKTTNTEFKTYLENNSEKFGFFLEDYTSGFPFAADVLFAQKPDNGYTSGKAVNQAFNKAIIIYDVKNSSNISSALESNAEILGINYTEYKGLSSESKALLNELLKNADYTKADFATIYEQNLIYAEIKSADRWTVQRDRILGYAQRMGYVFPSEYNSILNKDSVFQTVYREKNEITDFNSIKTKLDSVIGRVYTAENNPPTVDGTGGGGGGGGATKPSTPVAPDNTFSDIKNHWAENYITRLVENGAVNGYSDRTFKPDNTITRAEFTKIIVSIFELSGESKSQYSDVSKDDWYNVYIEKASASGIIQGSDGMFFPNKNITRQDAALIIHRVLTLKNITMKAGKEFSDNDEISEYAKVAVSQMSEIGVINGYDGEFMPKNNITRAEAVAMIVRALDLI